MTDLQIELTKLIGSKELSFGCYIIVHGDTTRLDDNNFSISYDGKSYYHKETWDYETFDSGNRIHEGYVEQHIEITEIIGHPATLEDLQRWIISKFRYGFRQEHSDYLKHIIIRILDNSVVRMDNSHQKAIKYDSTKDLLDQPEETLQEIVAFIKANQ